MAASPIRSIRHKLFNKCFEDLSADFQVTARSNFEKWQRDPQSVGWHRLTGMKANLFSAEIGYSARAVGLVTEDKGGKPVCVWLFIGTHEKYNNWIEVQRQRKADSYLSAVPAQRLEAQATPAPATIKPPCIKTWRANQQKQATPAVSPTGSKHTP
jgi:hypothetical protein